MFLTIKSSVKSWSDFFIYSLFYFHFYSNTQSLTNGFWAFGPQFTLNPSNEHFSLEKESDVMMWYDLLEIFNIYSSWNESDSLKYLPDDWLLLWCSLLSVLNCPVEHLTPLNTFHSTLSSHSFALFILFTEKNYQITKWILRRDKAFYFYLATNFAKTLFFLKFKKYFDDLRHSMRNTFAL